MLRRTVHGPYVQRKVVVDGGDDLIDRRVVDHVTRARDDDQLALTQFGVQTHRLRFDVDNCVLTAGKDRYRQLQLTCDVDC